MAEYRIADACEQLSLTIGAESDARLRMRQCRQALGLGRQAVLGAERLTDADMQALQSLLRLARRVSNGFCDTNTLMTQLAAIRMDRLGFSRLPVIGETKAKRVRTETASLAIADTALPDGWWDTQAALDAANAGRYLVAGTGADGPCSVLLRHLDCDEPFLVPQEYKKVMETLPSFRLTVSTGRVLFGAAENLGGGVTLPIGNGTYLGQLVSLRSGGSLKIVATLVRDGGQVDPFHQLPEFREVP